MIPGNALEDEDEEDEEEDEDTAFLANLRAIEFFFFLLIAFMSSCR